MSSSTERAVREARDRAFRGEEGDAPRISVVIPVRDDAGPLRRCLRALEHQSVVPCEVIVVDNGSSDDTSAVAREAGARLIAEAERGILAASAAGYDAAEGEIIARLDADCIPPTDWLQRIASAMAADSTVAAVTGGARFIDGPRRLRGPLSAAYLGAYYAVLTPTLGHVPLFGSNMAMRRTAWTSVSARVHRHDEDVHDDLDVAFHLGEEHRIRYVPGLTMGVSARPFESVSSFSRRVRRGFHSVVLHWPEQFPPLRWLTRRTATADQVAGRP